MSSTLAIAGVTRTLRGLVERALQAPLPAGLPADVTPTQQMQVTTLPLDRVRTVVANGNVLNLYLYSAVPNPGWRNGMPPPRGTGVAEAPLALNLHYLLTAFGQDDNELVAQLMLSRAMLALHDNPLLMPGDLSDALAAGGLQDQVDRVRLTPHPLGFDELSKLWMAYQTQYRLSAAYEASVVLIDSSRPVQVAPPVRSTAIVVRALSAPRLDTVTPQVATAAARLELAGRNLGDPAIVVRVGERSLVPDQRSDTRLALVLPADLPAGTATIQAVQQVPLGTPPVAHAGVGIESNALPFVLTPAIVGAGPFAVARGAVLTLTLSPPVGVAQRVSLLLDDLRVPAQPQAPGDPATSTTAAFAIPDDFAARAYIARVTVDGATSAAVIDTSDGSPTFGRAIGPRVTLT